MFSSLLGYRHAQSDRQCGHYAVKNMSENARKPGYASIAAGDTLSRFRPLRGATPPHRGRLITARRGPMSRGSVHGSVPSFHPRMSEPASTAAGVVVLGESSGLLHLCGLKPDASADTAPLLALGCACYATLSRGMCIGVDSREKAAAGRAAARETERCDESGSAEGVGS